MFNQKVISYPDSSVAFTNNYGNYSFAKDPGNYSLEFLQQVDWIRTSDSAIYSVSITNSDLTGFDFQTFPLNPKDSLSLSVTGGIPRCFSQMPFWIHYANNGTTLLTGSIKVIADPLFQYSNSSPVPDLIGDTLIWNFTDLYPGEQKKIFISYDLSNAGIGNIISIKAWADTNNVIVRTIETENEIICSYDPNDKQVSPAGIGADHLTHFNTHLDYTIRFQNCGNDTAFAVQIIDTLDSDLDLNTFQFIAASHDVYPTLSNTRLLTFRFDNINLPWEAVDETGSQGFVRYRISPKNNLPDPTKITNYAGIYFDRNPPIFTNQTLNTLTNSFTGINNISFSSDNKVKIYPNPTNNIITIEPFNLSSYELNIFDITGKNKFSKHLSGKQTFELENLNSGIYFYRIVFENGISSSGKIIIVN